MAYIRLPWPPDEHCLPGMIAQPTALCWTLAGVLEGLPSVLPRNVLTSTPLWWMYMKYLAIAQRFIAETGANDRVFVMAADVLSGSINGPFDAVVICNFIQVFSQDEARRAIKNVIKAVEPGGKLYIVGRVLDDDHLSPASALNSNLFFLNIYDGGQAHTERQHLEWLTDAGFESI